MGQMIPYQQRAKEFEVALRESESQFAQMLPQFLQRQSSRLFAVALRAIKDQKLAQCQPITVVAAVIQSAELGIPIDNTHGALVPFRDNDKKIINCQFIAMYRGLMMSVRRGGEIRQFSAENVFAGDVFRITYGTQRRLHHVPDYDAKRTKDTLLGAYATARWKDGTVDFDYLSLDELLAIKARARAQKGPWAHPRDFFEMTKKSALRRLCKKLPLSTEMAAWLDADEKRELDIEDSDPVEAEFEDVTPSGGKGKGWRPSKLNTDLEQDPPGDEHGQEGDGGQEDAEGAQDDAGGDGAPKTEWHAGIEIVMPRSLETACKVVIRAKGKPVDGMTMFDAVTSQVPEVRAGVEEALEHGKRRQEDNGASDAFFQDLALVHRAHWPKEPPAPEEPAKEKPGKK